MASNPSTPGSGNDAGARLSGKRNERQQQTSENCACVHKVLLVLHHGRQDSARSATFDACESRSPRRRQHRWRAIRGCPAREAPESPQTPDTDASDNNRIPRIDRAFMKPSVAQVSRRMRGRGGETAARGASTAKSLCRPALPPGPRPSASGRAAARADTSRRGDPTTARRFAKLRLLSSISRRMVNPMHVGRHDEPAQHAIGGGRQRDVRVVEHRGTRGHAGHRSPPRPAERRLPRITARSNA